MITDELYISNLSHDYDKMAETFKLALEHAHSDLKELTVTYDGKRLTIDFIGEPYQKIRVVDTANKLISMVTEKRKTDIDFGTIINNTVEIMKEKYGDDYMDKYKNVPYVPISK